MKEEQKKFADMGAYLRNAKDMVEVAIVDGKYYEEYTVRHVPDHLTEQKILADLASQFRTSGFRVMLFQYETKQNSHNFLRIMWSENPYTYPEEQSLARSLLGFFSRKKAPTKHPVLFGRAKEAYLSVSKQDRVTEPAAELLLDELHREILSKGGTVISFQRKDLDRIFLPLTDLKGSILPKLNTMYLIQQLEARGFRVEVQRMFQFTIKTEKHKKLM